MVVQVHYLVLRVLPGTVDQPELGELAGPWVLPQRLVLEELSLLEDSWVR